MKKIEAIHHAPQLEVTAEGKIVRTVDDRQVRVMATAEGYAMVRRKGCAPYVCKEKELTYR